MRIKIAQRLRPYSHVPGSRVLLPGSPFCLEVYPALLRIFSLEKEERSLIEEIPVAVHGPVKQFTVCQDLEHGCVRVWGSTVNGFYRFAIYPSLKGKSVSVWLDKGPPDLLPSAVCTNQPPTLVPLTERLSLGSHRKQEWPYLRSQCDLATVLPIWLALGQALPEVTREANGGTGSLLTSLERAIDSHQPETIMPCAEMLFLAGFEGMLSPRLEDSDCQGYRLPPIGKEDSPLALLSRGSVLIRSLFLQERSGTFAVLPALPPQFPAGRFLNLRCSDNSIINLEWTKKVIRRLEVLPGTSLDARFLFAGDVKSYRLRRQGDRRGCRYLSNAPVYLEGQVQYFFDNFQK